MNARRTLILALMGTLLGPLAEAQTAAPGATGQGDFITLSPFTVNTDKDTGYQAANTLIGGRIEAPLDKTPSSVSVITREFLDDIGAASFNDAAIWTTNAIFVNPTDFGDFTMNFRGLGGFKQTMNYFLWPVGTDSYNTERLEFARGPNSILFGEGTLSGIPTTFTKQARFRNFSQAQLRADSFGGMRSTVDLNRELLAGKAAVRVNILGDRGRGWREGGRRERAGIYVTGVIRLGDSAAFRIEAEYGKSAQARTDQNLIDQVSAWDTTTVYSGNGSTTIPAGAGLAFMGGVATRDYLVYDPTQGARGVQNLRGFYTTSGSNVSLLPEGRDYITRFPLLPSREFNLQPDNALIRIKYYFTTAYLEKRFGKDLFLQLAWNRNYSDKSVMGMYFTTLRVDVNQFLPNGTANPNFKKTYGDAQFLMQRPWEDPREFRLLGTYKFTRPWMEQRFSLLASDRRQLYRVTSQRLVRTNNPAVRSLTDQANFVFERRYLDQPHLDYSGEEISSNGIDVGYHRFNFGGVLIKNQSAQLAAIGSYFNGALTSIVGARRDKGSRENYTTTSVRADNTLAIGAATSDDAASTNSFGLVWSPVTWISPFFNYSRSYELPSFGNPLFDGNQPGPALGTGKDYGLRFNLFTGKIQGRIGYYDTQSEGRTIAAPAVTNINAIWNAMGLGGSTLPFSPRDTQYFVGKGTEYEVTANVSRRLRSTFNIAFPKTNQAGSYPGLKAYYAENLSRWEAAARDPVYTEATRNTIIANMAAIVTGIQGGADGRTLNGTTKYRANVYTTYSFTDGLLKRLAIGGGVNVYGRQIIGNVSGQPFNYIYQKQYFLGSAHASYSGKLGAKLRYRVQLNVSNLLDNDSLIFTSYARPTGFTYDIPNGFRYNDPRKFVLSTTFDY